MNLVNSCPLYRSRHHVNFLYTERVLSIKFGIFVVMECRLLGLVRVKPVMLVGCCQQLSFTASLENEILIWYCVSQFLAAGVSVINSVTCGCHSAFLFPHW
jgi:hypothetical protein